jgi:hypothetical protein
MSKHEFCAGVLFFCCLGLAGVGAYLALAALPDTALAGAIGFGLVGASIAGARLARALWRQWRDRREDAELDARMAARIVRESRSRVI